MPKYPPQKPDQDPVQAAFAVFKVAIGETDVPAEPEREEPFVEEILAKAKKAKPKKTRAKK